MIPNCEGCRYELETLEGYSQEGYDLYFAGTGLYEKGHLMIRLVNGDGEIILE